MEAGRARRAVFGAELKFPGLGAAVILEGPGRFGIDPQVLGAIIGAAQEETVADVVDPYRIGICQHVLVTQVRADVDVAELHLILVPAVGEREPDAVVRRDHVLAVFQAEPGEGGPFHVQLKALRTVAVVGAVAEHADAGAQFRVPGPACVPVIKPLAGKPRLFRARQVAGIDQAAGQHLPGRARRLAPWLEDRLGIARLRTIGLDSAGLVTVGWRGHHGGIEDRCRFRRGHGRMHQRHGQNQAAGEPLQLKQCADFP